MMTVFLLIAAALTVGAAGITLLAFREIRASRRRLRAACLAMAAAEQRAADEEAGKESALRLLEEQRTHRLMEYADYAARLQALETQYADTLRTYRLALGDKLVPFKRLH